MAPARLASSLIPGAFMTLNRKQFLRQSAALGGCCGFALAGATGLVKVAAAATPGDRAPGATGATGAGVTPLAERVTQGQKVIKRIVAELDRQVEEPTRRGIMEACGRQCFEASRAAGPKATAEQAAKFMDGIRKYVGPVNVRDSAAGTVVYFHYTQNPEGLKTADGYCLCPIFEDAPKGVSPTYCDCSVGYVRAMFQQATGRETRVELTGSVLRGGKTCTFTVTLAPSA